MPNRFKPRDIARYRKIIAEETEKFVHYENFESFFAFGGASDRNEIIEFVFDAGKPGDYSWHDRWGAPILPQGRNPTHYTFRSVLRRLILYIERKGDPDKRLFSVSSLFRILSVIRMGRSVPLSDEFYPFLILLIRACLYYALEEINGTLYRSDYLPGKMIEVEDMDSEERPPYWISCGNNLAGPFYFRGIGDYSWNLESSFYRKTIKGKNRKDPIYVDYRQLFQYYGKKKGKPIKGMNQGNVALLDRYRYAFGKQPAKQQIMDYKFIAWMQHSESTSPFIDFTESRDVAIHFALGEPGKPPYSKKAGLYFLDARRNRMPCSSVEQANDDIFKMELIFSKTPVGPFAPIKAGCLMNPRQKVSLTFPSLFELICASVPSYEIIDIQPNDRMKVQKGVFLFIHKAVFVDGEPLAALSKQRLRLEKKSFLTANKNLIMNQLASRNPIFNNGYLMKPYDFFKVG